jgi:hypothetical protein
MSKSSLIVFATLLAGCAGTSGWRASSIDGRTQLSFEESVASLQQALPEDRRPLFDRALADIWVAGAIAAAKESSEYAAEEYFALLDGLEYRDVIDLAASSGSPVTQRYSRSRAPRAPAASFGYRPPAYQGGGFSETGGGFNRDGGRTWTFDPSDWRPCC